MYTEKRQKKAIVYADVFSFWPFVSHVLCLIPQCHLHCQQRPYSDPQGVTIREGHTCRNCRSRPQFQVVLNWRRWIAVHERMWPRSSLFSLQSALPQSVAERKMYMWSRAELEIAAIVRDVDDLTTITISFSLSCTTFTHLLSRTLDRLLGA